MESFLERAPQILLETKEFHVLLFLDFDGTLVPIADHPDDVDFSGQHKKILKEISELPHVTLAVISGRQLSDLKKKIHLPGVIYIGNHGLEIEGPALDYVYPETRAYKTLIENLVQDLHRELADIPGILIENKKLTISVHYRQATHEAMQEAKGRLHRALELPLTNLNVTLRHGKKVWEIRPVSEWNKGSTTLSIMGHMALRIKEKVMPFYFGDDDTDEDAFRALRQIGPTVKITEDSAGFSFANYYLPSVDKFYDFLKEFVKERRQYGSAVSILHTSSSS